MLEVGKANVTNVQTMFASCPLCPPSPPRVDLNFYAVLFTSCSPQLALSSSTRHLPPPTPTNHAATKWRRIKAISVARGNDIMGFLSFFLFLPSAPPPACGNGATLTALSDIDFEGVSTTWSLDSGRSGE